MPKFGDKMKSLKNIQKERQKGGRGPLTFIPKNGSLTVRFLQEPEEWMGYVEHWDEGRRTSYPCTGENACPGCRAEARKSTRYLANAVDRETDKVVALIMPRDLFSRLTTKYEKYDTMLDRDYELSKSGEGFDTMYDADAEAPSKINLAKYKPLDLEEQLVKSFDAVFGEDEDDAPPARTSRKKPAFQADDDDDEEEDTEDEEDDELEDEDDEEQDDEEEADEDDLDAMSLVDLKAKAKTLGIRVTRGMDKAALIEAIEAEDGEDEEDEEADDEDGDEEDGEFYSREELEAMTLGDLRAIALENDIDVKGMRKPEIIDALQE